MRTFALTKQLPQSSHTLSANNYRLLKQDYHSFAMSQPQLAAVDLWSSLLQLLQRLPVQSAAQRESIHDSISDTVNKLCHAPALALPAWADLVDHLKVGLQLVWYCCCSSSCLHCHCCCRHWKPCCSAMVVSAAGNGRCRKSTA